MMTEPANGEKVANGSDVVSYSKVATIPVKDDGTYILGITLDKQSYSTLAAVLSNKLIMCFSVECQTEIRSLYGHEKPITRVKYSTENPALVYSSSLDGSIQTWDLRRKASPVQKFVDNTDACLKPISSFDFNSDENYLCGGTELIREDAFLIFWDMRTSKILGGYWNSHTDDITQVKFHPHNGCTMATGSTDGLINIFDLSQLCEDDALQHTMNTRSSVSSIMWHVSEDDCLSCLTHIEEMQQWEVGEAKPKFETSVDCLRNYTNVQANYFINMLQDNESLHLVSGTSSGNIQIWNINDQKVHQWCELNNGHSDNVRAVKWNPQNNTLFSCGEDGVICIWNQNP